MNTYTHKVVLSPDHRGLRVYGIWRGNRKEGAMGRKEMTNKRFGWVWRRTLKARVRWVGVNWASRDKIRNAEAKAEIAAQQVGEDLILQPYSRSEVK